MDGHFVPNLTFGPPIIKALRTHTTLPFDVHLMINNPEYSIKDYANSGADIITIHPETTIHLDRTLDTIQNLGVKVGVALLPSTNPNYIDYIIDKLDLILVMTVNPGFSGQKFIENQLEKIKIISEKIKSSGKNILLSVDGGINDVTGKNCIKAGADILVSAVVLSAQATDISVNKATKFLFGEYNTPEKILELGEEGLKNYIRSIDKYDSKVPNNFDELIKLPGVGRKTANVVLNCLFGKSTIAVDTHVFRVSKRLGLASSNTPKKVEFELVEIIDTKWLQHAHHWLILLGRYICKARVPNCPACPVKEYCEYYANNYPK
ncbi:Endonuclease III [Pseudolycoriella hygida]|uniref:ribulose-phosphate 3-epimerase n=1 Tax=Pseudolycoriella hygida TaxID=35572 RepID=A0A9Q0S4V5_9DIPT|nr:Endonuclease III [Pseudolycoriella hygida]